MLFRNKLQFHSDVMEVQLGLNFIKRFDIVVTIFSELNTYYLVERIGSEHSIRNGIIWFGQKNLVFEMEKLSENSGY